MPMQLRAANEDDLPELAVMNKQLIEDEGSSNPMGLEDLQRRMRDFLNDSWQADLILNGSDLVGYALYQFREDPFRPNLRHVYLRQYFIKREHRLKGYGLAGIELLREERFKGAESIGIDVLDSNLRGRRFWAKAGFEPYSIHMRLETT
ncbi:hypothetical protein J19TS2_19020 [Cohnella xylanilytica]|nr:hypothetical protein J19TS2_19020 [Cohnella xylanilytica]